MRKIITIILVLIIVLTSCTYNKYESIYGAWQCDDPYMYFDYNKGGQGEMSTEDKTVPVRFGFKKDQLVHLIIYKEDEDGDWYEHVERAFDCKAKNDKLYFYDLESDEEYVFYKVEPKECVSAPY